MHHTFIYKNKPDLFQPNGNPGGGKICYPTSFEEAKAKFEEDNEPPILTARLVAGSKVPTFEFPDLNSANDFSHLFKKENESSIKFIINGAISCIAELSNMGTWSHNKGSVNENNDNRNGDAESICGVLAQTDRVRGAKDDGLVVGGCRPGDVINQTRLFAGESIEPALQSNNFECQAY